jgi:hypothetical protein
MKDFKEICYRESQIFESHEIEGLNQDEINANEIAYSRIQEYLVSHDLKDLDEGVLGSILGGIAGFTIGPAIGKAIANALGIEKGILYDMFTSRVVVAALGAMLGKKI